MRRVAIGSMIGVLMLAGCGGGSDRSQAAMSANDDAASTAQAATSAAAVPEFTLTDAFLAKYQAYQEEAAKDPCALSPLLGTHGTWLACGAAGFALLAWLCWRLELRAHPRMAVPAQPG